MTTEYGMGRLPAPDEDDKKFLIRTIAPRTTTRTYRYWNDSGAWLNQGSTGTCVGHSWAHWLEDGPIFFPGKADPYEIYRECTKVDEWTANDNGDLHFGSSVRAGAKVAQAKGWISEYRWAWNLNDVVLALLEVGPVVMGTDWYADMMQIDRSGFVRATGSVVGGHAWVLNGVNTKERKARLKNSWGRGWGVYGRAWISFDDLETLIGNQGEACLAVEVK